MPAVSAAAWRAKRVIESASPRDSNVEEDELESEENGENPYPIIHALPYQH
jgi:hypothetical protein